MTDENIAQEPIEPQTAPTTDVVSDNHETSDQATKTFSQEELDAVVTKRLAREHRKWNRELAEKEINLPKVHERQDLNPESFSTTEDYIIALAETKAAQILRDKEIRFKEVEILSKWNEASDTASEKYDDFIEVTQNPHLPITEEMREAILTADDPGEVAYYLGLNIKESARISKLSPVLQAKEIAKLEFKLASEPIQTRFTKAPAPISPMKAQSSASKSFDTLDPRSTSQLSTEDWIEAERNRQRRQYELKRGR